MTTITEEVGRLVPQHENGALLRGLLLGVAVGATIAGLLILSQTLRERCAAQRASGRQGPSAPTQPPGPEPSPL
jgi:uncharacterized membrane protein